MNRELWKDAFEFVGVASIVASLIFVGLQLGQSEGIGNSEVIGNWSDRASSHLVFVADHADVWRRACAGEDLDPAEETIAAAVYRSYLHHAFASWWLAENALISGITAREHPANRFAANLWRYPGFRRLADNANGWSELGSGMPGGTETVAIWAAEVQARVEVLRELEPNPDFDVSLCGLE